jgi:hypothetical protein
MDEPRADQLAHRSFSGVLGIATLGIGMKHQDQLVHREASRMFIEEERQNGPLRVLVLPYRGRGIARRATLRVLVSHEE